MPQHLAPARAPRGDRHRRGPGRRRTGRRGALLLAAVLALLPPALAAPASAGPAVRAQGGGALPFDADAFLDLAYRHQLGRTPDDAGAAYWRARLADGLSPVALLDQLGTFPEHHRYEVRQAYGELLRRSPDPGGLDHWAGLLAGRLSPQDLRAELMASAEYAAVAGGGTPEGFVTAAYGDVLGRQPEPAGLQYWVGELARGVPRWSVALTILRSPEAVLVDRLPLAAVEPAPGAEVTPLPPVRVTPAVALDPATSVLVVTVDGRPVAGSVDRSGGSLVFTPAEQPTWVQPGRRAPAVATVLGQVGDVVERGQHTFSYRAPGPPPAQLPGGGRTLFPDKRLVAYYGHPGAPILGALGETGPEQAAQRVAERAARWAGDGRTVLPTFEIIATLALSSPGPDGTYSAPSSVAELRPWLAAARSVDGYVILDIQPGRADASEEARRYEELLVEPDVGLALDPEWTVGPGGVPGGGRIGSMDAAEINEVSAYLAELVERHDLPEKALVIHRFTPGMVTNADAIVDRPGVAIAFHADGFGTPEAKYGDYRTLLPPRFDTGLKLFFDEDTRLLQPAEVLALDPAPDVITYQ